MACVASPGKAFTSITPVVTTRVLARAWGVLPLLLWWALSVLRGLLPVAVALLSSR